MQDTWVRASRAGAGDDIGGWLTTIVSPVCLNKLRSRNVRREHPLDVHSPDRLPAGLHPADGRGGAFQMLGDLFDAVEIVSDKNATTYRRIFSKLADGPERAMMSRRTSLIPSACGWRAKIWAS